MFSIIGAGQCSGQSAGWFEWLTVQQVCMRKLYYSTQGSGQNETDIKSALESLMQSHHKSGV